MTKPTLHWNSPSRPWVRARILAVLASGRCLLLGATASAGPSAQRIMNQLYLDIKGMQRKSTATLKSSLTQKNKVWRAMFILNTANSRLRATPDDLDFMKTSYGLTDTDVNRVLRIINNK